MNYIVIGGAGFIGSHLVRLLLKERIDIKIVVYDNFTSGQRWHLEEVIEHPNLQIIEADIKDSNSLKKAIAGTHTVFHFASNPDIAKAIAQPDIDFWEGTYLTNNILEAMRVNNVKKLLYASGSGVYGEANDTWLAENYSPMLPISTYGASKLACEALICSYCHMFDMKAASFRFANVVGPNQTHGVVYDFIKRLLINDSELEILGDGTQSKPYIYVTDVLRAMLLVEDKIKKYDFFNVAPLDFISVNEIVHIVLDIMHLKNVKYKYTGGDRGWKGDVPVVRLKTDKIRKLGWKNEFTSKEAITKSAESILCDAKLNKFNWSNK